MRRVGFWLLLVLSVVMVSFGEGGLFNSGWMITCLVTGGGVIYSIVAWLNGKPGEQIMWPGRMALSWNSMNTVLTNLVAYWAFGFPKLSRGAWFYLVLGIITSLLAFFFFNRFESCLR